MTKAFFEQLESYMRLCNVDSAHDPHHVYRVLYYAMELAEEETVDYDVLITACMLHDIGRPEQFADPSVCHARAGAEKAAKFLQELGQPKDFTEKVCHCIQTHRFSKKSPPQTMEAKILFDADKLDVVGAAGVARTLLYQGTKAQPIYTLTPAGEISDGTGDTALSFFQEYKRKLEQVYQGFLTEKGQAMALQRQAAAVNFYQDLYSELSHGYCHGRQTLQDLLAE